MTHELQQRVNTAENFSTDLVHEIRNPLTSLKSASEILNDTDSKEYNFKLNLPEIYLLNINSKSKNNYVFFFENPKAKLMIKGHVPIKGKFQFIGNSHS